MTEGGVVSIVTARADDGRGVQIGHFDRRHRQAPQAPVGPYEVGDERCGRVPEQLGRGVVLLQHSPLAQHRPGEAAGIAERVEVAALGMEPAAVVAIGCGQPGDRPNTEARG